MTLLWLLAALAADPVQQKPIPLKNADPEFELVVPAGYAADSTTTYRHYQRKTGSAAWEKILLRIRFNGSPAPQHRGALVAGNTTIVPDASGEGKTRTTFTKWTFVEIPCVERWYVANELPMYSCSIMVPIRQQAITLEIEAVDTFQKEAMADLREVLASLRGRTDWLPTDKLRELEAKTVTFWPVYAAAGVELAFLVTWGVAFRTSAMRAHGLRTAWHFAMAILLLFAFMKGDGFSGNYVLLLLLGPLLGFHLLMGIRRVKLGIEFGD